MTRIVKVEELVLEALPEVALPPVVLSLTEAEPVLALCELVFVTFTLLLFVTWTSLEL